MRRVYSSYIKSQLESQPESIILFLPYYDTTEKVREILESENLNVRELEKQGSIILIDIMTVLRNQSHQVPEIDRVRDLITKLEKQYPDKTIFGMADMSVFHHLKKAKDILEYEKSLHMNIKIEKWKELCLYSERDFSDMFTDDEAKQLLDYHEGKIIRI